MTPTADSTRPSTSGVAGSGGARPFADHRWREAIQRSALTIKGLTYMPTGATVAALTAGASGDPGGRAQLGLPLHLDARLDVHPPGAASPGPGLGGGRVHAVRRRPRAQQRRRAADHVRDRRSARPDRDVPRGPLGLLRERGRCGSATVPSTSARTTSSARCSTRSSSTPCTASACPDGCGRSCRHRRSAPPTCGASPTRASGRPAASRSTMSPRSSCAGWRWTAPRSWPRFAATPSWRRSGAPPPRRSTPTSSPTGSPTACCASTTTPMRSMPRRSWRRCSASCPATTSGCTSRSWRSRMI